MRIEDYLEEHCSNYLVFHIAGVIPRNTGYSLDFMGEMFKLHPEARLEMILDKNGCQLLVKDLIKNLFDAPGLPVPDKKYYAGDLHAQFVDWYDY